MLTLTSPQKPEEWAPSGGGRHSGGNFVSKDWLLALSNTQKEEQTKAGVKPEVGFSSFRSIHLPIHPSSRAYFITHPGQ